MFKQVVRKLIVGSCAVAALLGSAAASAAGDVVKVAYMKIPPLVAVLYAQRNGLFAKEGIDLQLSIVNGEPQMMSSLVAGAVDIGMTAVGGVVLARGAGQPVRVFGTGDLERGDDIRNWITANKGHGVTSVKDLVGKTVAIVAPRSQAELLVREHLMANHIALDAVKFVYMPFPQMQTALETGNVDAAMVVEPFHSAILASTKIQPMDIAFGTLPDFSKAGSVALGGWFTRADWIAAHPDLAARFLRAISASHKALMANRKLADEIFEKDFNMPPAVAEHVPLPLRTGSLEALPKDYTPMIDAMVETGLMPKAYPATDLVVTVKY